MYRAIKDVGGYKIGDEVPDSKAELWLKMYDYPHVEKVEERNVSKDEPKENLKKEESALGNILEDYLARNQSVVKKNVSEDKLSKHQLQELLKLEESDKKRPIIINAIKQRLEK